MKAEDLKDEHLSKLVFPVIGSPKLDGIRALKIQGQVLSSTFKPIPNHHIRKTLEKELPDGADGEIIVGDVFQEVTSGVMSAGGVPDFKFWMFDLVNENHLEEPYLQRQVKLTEWRTSAFAPNVIVVPTLLLQNLDQMRYYETECIEAGFEGIMLRSLDGPYKCGRSTLKQGWLLKRKPFEDSEAVIIGFEERLTNTNELQKNELGLAKRSSAKAGKVPMNTLGKFIATDIHGLFPGVELKIGTGKGLTDKLRKEVWENREAWMGRIIKYKFQRTGTKDAPRLPIFLGERHPEDIAP